MSKLKITLRQKEILKKICGEYKYVTVSSIAEKLSISSRTVLRELSDIDLWLEPYGCSLDKKAGIGIRLKGSLEERKKVLDSLEEGKEIKSYSPKERQIIIIGELLQEKEPVKLYSFTRSLNVTEGTVSHDLDKVEEWLEAYNLKLIRKPGLGVYVEGQEEEIRKAIVNLIYENINEIELLDLIKENLSTEVDTRERLLNLIEKDTIRKLEALIFELEEKTLGYRLTDNAYIGLIVHLALAIQRIKKNEKISMDKVYLDELKEYTEFIIASNLTIKISSVFNIEIPEDEIGYITMHLRGSKGFENKNTNIELEDLAKEMIKIAEAETGSFLEHNEQLLTGLINHLAPAINRIKMKMKIRNPLLKEIKEYYPDLFKVATKAVMAVENHIGIKMPDSEIAYIAMHIGAALEKKQSVGRRVYKAVVSCTTGIGTSGLLAARIEKEYDNIQIVDVISSLHINHSMLKDKGVDFIIATVPIEKVSIPVVVVNPLLFEKDKEKVAALVKGLRGKPSANPKQEGKALNLKEKLSTLKLYTDGILQILNNFFIVEYKELNAVNDVIKIVSRRLGNKGENEVLIEKDLIAREEKGTTVITGFNSLLLHCRTNGVKELYFGAVRIKNNLYSMNAEDELEQIKLAIIMLVPESSDKLYIEIMSFISSKLVNEPEFITCLKEGLEEVVYTKLNNYLDEFYTLKSN
jgi:mannitol operon transcriptional antiterminator